MKNSFEIVWYFNVLTLNVGTECMSWIIYKKNMCISLKTPVLLYKSEVQGCITLLLMDMFSYLGDLCELGVHFLVRIITNDIPILKIEYQRTNCIDRSIYVFLFCFLFTVDFVVSCDMGYSSTRTEEKQSGPNLVFWNVHFVANMTAWIYLHKQEPFVCLFQMCIWC